MANENRPWGLKPVSYASGVCWTGGANVYVIPAADTNSYAIGDPVKSGGSADSNGVPSITLAAATGAIRGVVVGLGTRESLMANPSNLDSTTRPAGAQSIDWYATVVDDPNTVFEIQESGTPMTAADVGLNINMTVVANNGFTSKWTADTATKATTATLQLKLLGLARRQDNAFGAFAKWLVKINNHELSAGTAGV